jgi:hypothetical protein
MTISNPKHFKNLRLIISGLAKGVHHPELDYIRDVSPLTDPEGSNHTTPRVINTLTITDDGKITFRSVDERVGWVFVETSIFSVNKKTAIGGERHQYFRTQEWIDKARVNFEKYLDANPNMREWGENVKKTQVYELLKKVFPQA